MYRRITMPERQTLERAREDAREGRSPSTQAGEFVREEMQHVRQGKHGVRSTKQAIAIGLSKARRAGIELRPPRRGSARTRKQAQRDYSKGQSTPKRKPSARRSRATRRALKREGRAGSIETVSFATGAHISPATKCCRSLPFRPKGSSNEGKARACSSCAKGRSYASRA